MKLLDPSPVTRSRVSLGGQHQTSARVTATGRVPAESLRVLMKRKRTAMEKGMKTKMATAKGMKQMRML